MRLFSDCDSLLHFYKADQPSQPHPLFVRYEGFCSMMFGLIAGVIADIIYFLRGSKKMYNSVKWFTLWNFF